MVGGGLTCICAMWHIYPVTHDTDPLAELKTWFAGQVEVLWPVALGSLSLRRSPCIREHCSACASGEKHVSYVLYVRSGGARSGVYVPDELVPQIRAAVTNGRKLQALLAETGVRTLKALKDARSARGSQR